MSTRRTTTPSRPSGCWTSTSWFGRRPGCSTTRRSRTKSPASGRRSTATSSRTPTRLSFPSSPNSRTARTGRICSRSVTRIRRSTAGAAPTARDSTGWPTPTTTTRRSNSSSTSARDRKSSTWPTPVSTGRNPQKTLGRTAERPAPTTRTNRRTASSKSRAIRSPVDARTGRDDGLAAAQRRGRERSPALAGRYRGHRPDQPSRAGSRGRT